MKNKKKYSRIVLARVVEKQISLKTIEVTFDFANFLDSEYKDQFGKHCAAYPCCWFNNMIVKYAAVCGIYRLPKDKKSCD